MTTVKSAIRSIELLADRKFVRRYRHFNLDTNRTETAYVFRPKNAANCVTFDCISELRAEAQKLEALWS